jgi:hypothetical protein
LIKIALQKILPEIWQEGINFNRRVDKLMRIMKESKITRTTK